METIFALSNGYFGIRGTPDEMVPVDEDGTFVNGFYESWPIVYPEAAFGFANTGQTIVNVPDATTVKLSVDGDTLDIGPRRSTRTLDMRRGILEREAGWLTESGKTVTVRSERLVSLEHRHIAAIRWEVTVEGGPAEIVVHSEILNKQDGAAPDPVDHSDPRRSRGFDRRVLEPKSHEGDALRITLGYRTRSSRMALACGIDHVIESDAPVAASVSASGDHGVVALSARLGPGDTLRFTKLISYHTDGPSPVEELVTRVNASLDRAKQAGFDSLAGSQEHALERAWDRSDVRVGGRPRLQQAIRWNLFQLIQATHCIERSGVPAKGLTSQGYDGHYFWDMDMFFSPFMVHTRPDLAKELLLFRYDTLGEARTRAAEMSEAGALYPWRTINGLEASAFFPAGTAQYHINAAVAHAIKKYDEATDDEQFLIDAGAEIVLETARMWFGLGFFSDDGAFHLYGVTGPDEYTALVNDNTYTNLMAQMHLRYAADVIDRMARTHPDVHAELTDRVGLTAGEIEGWRRAADRMTILYDDDRGIHAQDADFLELEVWDFSNTPAEDYPLLLNHHPLVLYRHQVLKQSDVVLAMVLRGDLFDADQKARNFGYYEPLTTDDSSLSTPIQAIIAAEVGAEEVATRCFDQAVFADLADVYANASDGVHLASCGATWMALVMGFGGMRDYDGSLTFDPKLPKTWESLEFSLTIRDRVIDVALKPQSVAFTIREGEDMPIRVRGQEVALAEGSTVSVVLP